MSRVNNAKGYYFPRKLSSTATQKLYGRMASSMLPRFQALFTKKEYDKLDGSLRRNDLSVFKESFLQEYLQKFKTGEIDISTELFRDYYQFTSLFSKLPEKGNDQLCKIAGYKKLLKGEKQCAETNRRIKANGFPLDSIFGEVQELISKILGPLPVDFLNKQLKFGPGSTVNDNNRSFQETSEFFKLSDRLIVPEKAKTCLAAFLSYQEGWIDGLKNHYHLNDTIGSRLDLEKEIFKRHLKVVPNDFPNKIGFVLKDVEEHRSIGVEINGLVILQMVLGSHIRDALLKYGLNLNTQGKNRHLVRFAKTFKKATIDMLNASNTVAYELVKKCIPPDWFRYFDMFRTSHGVCPELDENHGEYEMFSSMGNGFTFELESLIFFAMAICRVRADQPKCTFKGALRQIAVYGDDVIIPADSAVRFKADLELFGFHTNEKKSYLTGKFFESCGHDFYDSTDVRPFFLKRLLYTTRDLYFLCNSLMYKIIKTESDFLLPVYTVVMKEILKFPHLLGPLHFNVTSHSEWEDSTDDLEACLRVPLIYAQKHGGIKFDTNQCVWEYKKLGTVALEVPLSKNRQYAVQNMRYLMFLRGTREGKAILRGKTEVVLKRSLTSQWDGTTTRRAELLLWDLFSTLLARRL